MRHATMLVAILAFVPLTSATAQEPPPVKVGDRVRVTAPDVRSAGIVQLLTTDSLVMRPEYVFVMRPEYVAPNRVAIPLASVTRLESTRWKGRAWAVGEVLTPDGATASVIHSVRLTIA